MNLKVFQRGGRKQHKHVFVFSRSLLLNHLEPRTLTSHNANRHCRVRFYTFVRQPLSKHLYTVGVYHLQASEILEISVGLETEHDFLIRSTGK